MSKFLDVYYILAYNTVPNSSVRSLTRKGVPSELIRVVTSTDADNLKELVKWSKEMGIQKPLIFNREDFLHDKFLSLMSEQEVRKHFPKTDTPARRAISHYENSLWVSDNELRHYAVFDDDYTFHNKNPFREITSSDENWDDHIWERAMAALTVPQVWSCHFILPYTWSASYKEGLRIQREDFSTFHRKGAISAQSGWVFCNDRLVQWFSPIVTDYITTSRYAAQGMVSYCLNEYGNVAYPNVNGEIWSKDDPNIVWSRPNLTTLMRCLGVKYVLSKKKPYRKFLRTMIPHIIEQEK